jgi:glycosyltransferase involved in cell wall biosynthesis
MNRLKIAFLGNQISPGGGAMSLFLMVKSLPNTIFEKYVFVSQCRSEEMRKDLQKYCEEIKVIKLREIVSCQTYSTNYKKLERIIFSDKNNINNLISLLKEKGIQILHINNSVFAHIYKHIKENTDIKIVSHIRELINHSGIGPLQNFIIDNIYSFSDAIITISDNERTPFLNHALLFTVPNPFDFAVIKKTKNKLRIKYQIDEDTVLIGMAGRFDRNKGHLLFLRSLRWIIDNKLINKNYKFVVLGINPPQPMWKTFLKTILGKDNYREAFFKFIKSTKLSDMVILIEYTYHFFKYLADIDIFVRPSLSGDPWGRDIIEAMAFSKPVIACGNSDFYIKENISGYLVAINQPEILGEKIAELIENTEKRQLFGQNGFKIVMDMCNFENYSKKLLNIYNKLLINEQTEENI